MTEPASSLTSRLSGFNPFSRSKKAEDNDEKGEETTTATVAGGGHSARQTAITKNELRVSHALKSFLVHQKVLSTQDAGLENLDEATESLKELLHKPHINVPEHLTDRSHPLPEYFISSSHNTYLMAHQLYGGSSAEAYKIALETGSRCVEIDAWDNDDEPLEPKVTHGYTLVSHISFRSVCETIRDCVDREAANATQEQGNRAAPILLSLENHCGTQGQLRLVDIMKETWGDRLLSEAIRQEGHNEQEGGDSHVLLSELGSKIVVIVEHHQPSDTDSSDDSSESENEEEKAAKKAYKEKKKAAPATIIAPELAALGIYAQSVKPSDNTWYDDPSMYQGPHHHLINVSETGLSPKIATPEAKAKISIHNSQHLMRVFPKGTRITSANLNPVPFWGVGAQICALNWQTFGAGMQLNEALFSGTDGYVLKPAALCAGGSGQLTNSSRKKKLIVHIAGATDIPLHGRDEDDKIKPYVTATLMHPSTLDSEHPKRKTAAYKHHHLSFLHHGENPPVEDPIWDETLEWEYEDNELVFLRLLIKSDDSFKANPVLAVTCVRLLYLKTGEWLFVRMLDLRGAETRCSLLLRCEIVDV